VLSPSVPRRPPTARTVGAGRPGPGDLPSAGCAATSAIVMSLTGGERSAYLALWKATTWPRTPLRPPSRRGRPPARGRAGPLPKRATGRDRRAVGDEGRSRPRRGSERPLAVHVGTIRRAVDSTEARGCIRSRSAVSGESSIRPGMSDHQTMLDYGEHQTSRSLPRRGRVHGARRPPTAAREARNRISSG
jgi:hypothetical protein